MEIELNLNNKKILVKEGNILINRKGILLEVLPFNMLQTCGGMPLLIYKSLVKNSKQGVLYRKDGTYLENDSDSDIIDKIAESIETIPNVILESLLKLKDYYKNLLDYEIKILNEIHNNVFVYNEINISHKAYLLERIENLKNHIDSIDIDLKG